MQYNISSARTITSDQFTPTRFTEDVQIGDNVAFNERMIFEGRVRTGEGVVFHTGSTFNGVVYTGKKNYFWDLAWNRPRDNIVFNNLVFFESGCSVESCCVFNRGIMRLDSSAGNQVSEMRGKGLFTRFEGTLNYPVMLDYSTYIANFTQATFTSGLTIDHGGNLGTTTYPDSIDVHTIKKDNAFMRTGLKFDHVISYATPDTRRRYIGTTLIEEGMFVSQAREFHGMVVIEERVHFAQPHRI